MRVSRLVLSLGILAILFAQCQKEVMEDAAPNAELKSSKVPEGSYTITVENVSMSYDYFESGVQAVPEGKDSPGPALPGDKYKFSFHAGPHHKLTFATMYGWSNDGFFAPGDDGISLFENGMPVTNKDITDEIMLWDAGTEENHAPGMNVMQGDNVIDGMVQLMSIADPAHDYGTVEGHLKITLHNEGGSLFTVTVENLNGNIITPISPIVWGVYYYSEDNDQNPIFTEGEHDKGEGLENVAESGDAGPLSNSIGMNSGYVSPVAPVLWVLHDKKDMPVFTEGMAVYDNGLEVLAETGNPGPLDTALMDAGYETGAQAMRTDGTSGPLFPGQKYEIQIHGKVGQTLSIASMLGASNDIFFSTGDKGIKLDNGKAEKDLTHFVELYDAGTEVNEYPGAGIHQGPLEGTDENGAVKLLTDVDDGFTWPAASEVIKVTIRKN